MAAWTKTEGKETGATESVGKEAPVSPEPSISAPKRRRGRPTNAERAARAASGPQAVPKDAAAVKKRGRPKKKRGLSDAEKSVLAQQIMGLHKMASIFTGIPEIELDTQEAGILGEAVANVSAEYGLSIGGKTGALFQLIAACGIVYVPRFVHMKKRIAQTKAEKATEVNNGSESTTAPAGA